MQVVRVLFLCYALFMVGCSHPLDIAGEGDILSASGNRDCLLGQAQSDAANCTENFVTSDYLETYYAVAHPGWQFHRWVNYCAGAATNECGFDVPAGTVDQFWGETAPPLVAIFRKTQNTGLNSLYIGHSFFVPFAQGMPAHASAAGFSDHSQSTVFSGGGSGAPQALWENADKRAAIQAVLDNGDTEILGMTYHYEYPGIEGYVNWVDYALAQNPDTRFFVGMPWLPFPASTSAAIYETQWHGAHPAIMHPLIDALRAMYPGVDFFCIPYGQSAVELRTLFAAGSLPDVSSLTGGRASAIFTDSLGHPGDILRDLGRLVWLNAIYDVDLISYDHDPGYTADLKSIARGIMEGHDPAYDAPYH